jgi:hypothetical protein
MADTKISALPAATLPLDGTELLTVVQGGSSKKVAKVDFSIVDLVKTVTVAESNSTTTAAAATGLAATVDVGTYLVKYWVVYQSAATTTGIQMYLDHTGTATRLAATWYTLTTGTTATSGVADQATTLTAQMMEGKGQRANNVASGPTQGVDTAAADQFAVMEGIITVTVTGTLNFMYSSEVAASAVTLQIGSSLVLTKVI